MKRAIQRIPVMATCLVALAACSARVTSGVSPGDGGAPSDAAPTMATGDPTMTAAVGVGGAQGTGASAGSTGVGASLGAGGSVGAGGGGVGASAPLWAVTGLGVGPAAIGTSAAGVTTIVGTLDATATDFGGPLPCSVTVNTMFLASFDASGHRLWFRCFTPFVASGFAVGPNGDLAFSGWLRQPVDFGTGTLDPGSGNWPVAIVGLDASGTVRFALEAPGDLGFAPLAVDADGAVTAAGQTSGYDFGTGSPVEAGMWIASWDKIGAPLRATNAGEPFYWPGAIAVDSSGDVAVVGSAVPQAGNPSAPVQDEPFILDIDPAGQVAWTLLGVPLHPHPHPRGSCLMNGVAFGSQGDVFASGNLARAIDFGLGPLDQVDFVIDARAGVPVWQAEIVDADANSSRVAASATGAYLVGGVSLGHPVIAGQQLDPATPGEQGFGFLADFDAAGHPLHLAPIDAAIDVTWVAAAFGPGFRVATGQMLGGLLTAGQSGGHASGGYLVAFPE
ncbi:MAG TPA: hypothetical protein VGM56_33335 [Byssovorax sp.]